MYNDPIHTTGELVIVPAMFFIGRLAGFALRQRSTQAEEAEDRARAERERAVAARRRVAEERAGSRVSCTTSPHCRERDGAPGRSRTPWLPQSLSEDKEALTDVEKGRAALAEMRHLLGAMHDGEDAELAPQPGLDSLDALVERVGRAGLPVRLQVEGDASPLPRAVDLSAYRIVQEGSPLLEARQGQPRRRNRPLRGEDLELEVRDDGVGTSSSDGLGHGLVGVRERVKIYGGEMSAAAGQEGGFVLTARLLLEGQRA